jgi:arylsulfatase A-like enzyme
VTRSAEAYRLSRRTLLGTGALATTSLLAQGPPNLNLGSRRPNVVFIITDDQGWWDLSLHGNRGLATPNMDRIAREGCEFTRFYASPVCTPTRASLMTGRYYQRTGAIDTYRGLDTLDAEETTLGQVFQRAGYRTACIGKWHLGRYMRYHPQNRGFGEFFGFWQYGHINRYNDSDELWEGRTPVKTTGYVTDVLTDRAFDFLRSPSSDPYLLYLAYNAPHWPYLVGDPEITRHWKPGMRIEDARIYGMVRQVDESIGKILNAIDEKNTIVVFMSDNGGVSRAFQAGLRGYKGSVYEGGVRVPFFVRWPGKIAPGTALNTPGHAIDILPTLTGLAGIPLKTARPLDGVDLSESIRTGKDGAGGRYLYHQWNRNRPLLEVDPTKQGLDRASWAICSPEGWKLHQSGELYNLTTDPGEANNVAAREPARVRELDREFRRWFVDVTNRRYGRVPIQAGRLDENPVEIDMTWANVSGGAEVRVRNYNRDSIAGLMSGARAEWNVEFTRAGRYRVQLEYGAAQSGARARLSSSGKAVDHLLTETPSGTVFRTDVGPELVAEHSGPATVVLEGVNVQKPESVQVHKIWLTHV